MTSSQSTKKPTGSCAACQKEGAAKRCRSCLDVGIDIFFCNRECQVMHWKTHKAFCGKSAIIVFDNKYSKNAEKEKIDYNESTFICTNCGKSGKDLGCNMRVCSKCKKSHYCSRECQVAHWPMHKEICKEIVAMEENLVQTMNPTEAKIRDLFEHQWMLKAGVLLSAAVFATLKHEELRKQPPTKVVYVDLEFNYNAQTFLLAEEPKAVPITSCFDRNEILEKYQNDAKRLGRQRCAQYAVVTCEEANSSFFHLVVLEEGLPFKLPANLPLQYFFANTALKSDLFQGWGVIRDRNFQKQNAHWKKSHLYSLFLHNALRLLSKKPRHLTHGINIHLKMGKEPGQIAEFLNYEVKLLSELKTLNNEIASMTPKKEREYMTKYGLDVQNNPRLLESRKRDPNTIMIVIYFQDNMFQ
ncbi:hypothetical protein CTEN210_08827 [Chaetoceros tenuissimus]|uniref:MYND-type domain-containing protein n=1 Tax=Chaetoceros tenuissimus TaxID=426638 RepID=A0AAD3H6F3_9STRA|nr:hypothetical protein CTEN210_08827 [Chaetoceros tenuissimus]